MQCSKLFLQQIRLNHQTMEWFRNKRKELLHLVSGKPIVRLVSGKQRVQQR